LTEGLFLFPNTRKQ